MVRAFHTRLSAVAGRSTTLLFALVFSLVAQACRHEVPLEALRRQGRIVADTLEVTILRDETPGFPYPRMRHEILFVGLLTVPGFIDSYDYQSQGQGFGAVFDYVGGYLPEPGTPFRFEHQMWTGTVVEAGATVAYTFAAYSPHARSLEVNDAIPAQVFRDGPVPVAASRQLTGPNYYNSRPVFSSDGTWIYYQSREPKTGTYRLHRMPADGGQPEVLEETPDSIGGFALTHNDTRVTYIRMVPSRTKSQLVTLDLQTGTRQSVEVPAFLADRGLLALPDGTRFLAFADPATTPAVALVEAETGAIERLVAADTAGTIVDFGYRPGTGEVSYGILVPRLHLEVRLLDLQTRRRSIFAQIPNGVAFAWAPNGVDYAFARWLDEHVNLFIHESGVERQVTSYPGADFEPTFSPDGRTLAFTSRRRGETQVWRIDLDQTE